MSHGQLEGKTDLDPYLTLYTKINFRQITDLNIKGKTLKHPKGNTGEQLHDLGAKISQTGCKTP